MSRVPADTVLLRLALAAAIALPLSGCGSDDPETASTPVAPAATTPATGAAPDAADPAATTGATTPAPIDTGSKAKEATDEAFQETKKVAEEAGKKASPAKQSNDELADQMKRSYDALKAKGLNVGKPVVSGADNAALTIDNGTITVVFFQSPRAAAAAGAATESALKDSPQKMKLARKANRLFILSLPVEPTAKQLDTYRQVRQIVNGVA